MVPQHSAILTGKSLRLKTAWTQSLMLRLFLVIINLLPFPLMVEHGRCITGRLAETDKQSLSDEEWDRVRDAYILAQSPISEWEPVDQYDRMYAA